jgi:sugar phosphate isomerase/epimerase
MLQNFELKSKQIRDRFVALKNETPQRFARRMELSFSNWVLGTEDLEVSLSRLANVGVGHVELHGNHHGRDLGYRPGPTRTALANAGVEVSGICGIFSPDNDLSSNRAVSRQAALDYIRRELAFAAEVDASYLIVVPGAVGRAEPADGHEVQRSADTLRIVAEEFSEAGVRAAIEPIRAAEVSLVHTIGDALAYIDAVGHPAVAHINGDVYHMQSEEPHIGEAIIEASNRLINLHLADSTRDALGTGSLDLDTIIMAAYLIGFNRDGCFATPEPLGPGGDPYPAMFGQPDPIVLDRMVRGTVECFREREQEVLSL